MNRHERRRQQRSPHTTEQEEGRITDLNALIADTVATLLARHGSATEEEVMRYLLATHPEEMAAHREALIRAALLADIQACMADLPPLAARAREAVDVPTTAEDDPATWRQRGRDDLAHAEEVELYVAQRKLARDQARLDDLQAKYEVLRPYLERDPTMTVEDALDLLARDQAKKH